MAGRLKRGENESEFIENLQLSKGLPSASGSEERVNS